MQRSGLGKARDGHAEVQTQGPALLLCSGLAARW